VPEDSKAKALLSVEVQTLDVHWHDSKIGEFERDDG